MQVVRHLKKKMEAVALLLELDGTWHNCFIAHSPCWDHRRDFVCAVHWGKVWIFYVKKNLITLFVQVPADLHNVRCLNTVGVFNFVP